MTKEEDMKRDEGFTPGPWHQYTNEVWRDAGYIKTEDGTTVAHAKLFEADARLIAAAPDLLDACEFALLSLAFLDPENPQSVAAVQRLEEAIAKATGESP